MAQIELFDVGLPQTFNLLKKKIQYLWNTMKWGTVKSDVAVIGRCSSNLEVYVIILCLFSNPTDIFIKSQLKDFL